MNDRPIDNQFPANPLTQEQLRLLQNLAALTGQGLLGANNNNMNRSNASIGLQSLLNPLLAGTALAAAATTSTSPNLNDSTLALDQHHQQQQQQHQQHQHQQQQQQLDLTQRLHQQLQQIVQQSQRQQQPHPTQAGQLAGEPASLSIRQQQSLQNSLQSGPLPGADQQKRKRGRPPLSAPSTSAGSSAAIDYSYMNMYAAVKNQQDRLQRDSRLQQDRQRDIRQQQERDNLREIRLAQERQRELRLQQVRQQLPHPSQVGDPASLSIRQQQSLQNSLQVGPMPVLDQQKRKRGRPPSSVPSTSAAAAGSSAAIDYNYINMFAAVKSQQDREKMQRENKAQQDRQRELRLQQERERAERQREHRMQQERERQRAEMERQRKAQLRLALQDIDRERRRQHMIMVRNLEAYKRNEEREKTMNAMMAERNKLMERRMHQKRLEVELIKDIRKPIDDMMLKNQKPLATLNRIPGLKLPGKAFADLLMSYEFLFNFGETVGLELKEIPDMNTLQLGLLNLNNYAEDQFISVLHHLCMFAVKDPRFPYTGSLKEIENLERTNEGLSQLLHFYLQVLTLNAKTDMEHEYRLYKLIEQKYFLSLNATQKVEMLAFICNELLCSQTVTKQMEETIENVAKLRKDKWVLENEIRKYRVIKTKRELKEEAGLKAKEAAAAAINTNGSESEKTEDDKITDSKDQIKTDIKREEEDKTNKSSLTNGSSLIESTPNKRENETDTSIQPNNNTADLDDLEPGMTNEELNKKIENLTRQYNKTSNKLDKAINSMRSNPLGQDRYRRRYWVLPQIGGVFVEGMESSEPEELENNKFTEEELIEYEKEQQVLNELANNIESTEQEPEKMDIKDEEEEEKEDDEIDIKDDVGDVKEEDEAMDIKDDDAADTNEIKEEVKIEAIENCAPDGDKEVNEASDVNEATGANESVEPNESNEPAGEENNSLLVSSSPWFSILPRNSCDFLKASPENAISAEGEDSQKKVGEEEGAEGKAELSSEELRAMRHELCPALAKRLEEMEAEQYESPKKIHPQFQHGWWRITDSQQLKAILSVLHERGARERLLHKHLTKHFQYACNSCKNTTVDFEITSYDRQLAGKNYGAPMPHNDEDSADDLKDGEEDEEEEDEFDEETGDDKAIQQATIVPSKKSKRKKVSRSARSRRLRARAAARKKVENSKNKLALR